MPKAVIKGSRLFSIITIIILLIGFIVLGYFAYNTKKIISQQSGLISEQKIKIQGLEGKLKDLEDKEIEILSKLNILQSMSNLSRVEKNCELSGLKIIKADYSEGKISLGVENSNNIDVIGLNFKAYSGNNLITSDKLEGVSAFGSKEFLINSDKPDEVIIAPKILVDGDQHVCNKEVRSKISELVDINGEFNVTAIMIVNGESKDVNSIIKFEQTGTEISGTFSARKNDGSMGQPFDIAGSVNGKILNLEASNVDLPAGSIEGINSDLVIDIILEGIVVDNNKIEGSDIGDIILRVKDYPAPGVIISIEGIFSGYRL